MDDLLEMTKSKPNTLTCQPTPDGLVISILMRDHTRDCDHNLDQWLPIHDDAVPTTSSYMN